MKLIKTKVKELYRNIPGGDLVDAKIDYEVKTTSGELTYNGPKIPSEVWLQIVSFLKWANDEAHSEAQVRLFVSPKHKTWKAWAFPQEGHTGLSSEEIQDEEFQKQRAALFENDDDWYAWGTVHSHAGITAFQSMTDEADEEDQDGLHITIGNMNDKQYSFHARIYHKKDMYEPDMSLFWETGDVFKNLPPEVELILPSVPADKLARLQMCIPVKVDFPEQWKTNYRKPAAKTEPATRTGRDKELDDWLKSRKDKTIGLDEPFYMRLKEAAIELLEFTGAQFMDLPDLIEELDHMDEVVPGEIMSICRQYGVEPADLIGEINRMEIRAAKDEGTGNGQNNGFTGSDDDMMNYPVD